MARKLGGAGFGDSRAARGLAERIEAAEDAGASEEVLDNLEAKVKDLYEEETGETWDTQGGTNG